ncbi:hypothetical protein PAEPH01_1625 [Pancytospora epiphaga]|nr:hypothetical protein PAEPH01_1625 [Pancytospora epiphaga]
MTEEKSSFVKDGVAARDAFFHNSVNISDWMKEKVTETVAKRGYTVVIIRCDAEVMTRMSQVTAISTVTVHFKDSKGTIFSLDGYSSVNKEYDKSKNTRWLVDALKEIEMEAVLKFGGKALKTQVDPSYVPKSVNVNNAEVQDKEEFKVEYYFATTVAEMTRILSEDDYIMRWTFGRAVKEEGCFSFDSVTIKDISVENKKDVVVITMKYKRADWTNYSSVVIRLSQLGDNLRLVLKQSNIPLGSAELVKRHWYEQIFITISQLFRCPMKDI